VLSHQFKITLECFTESESYVTTDGQPASLSWNKAPIWGLRPDFYYCQTVAGLLMWGALSDERTGLSSRGTRDHILLSQIRDFPFRGLLRLAGLRWRYSTPPPHGSVECFTEMYILIYSIQSLITPLNTSWKYEQFSCGINTLWCWISKRNDQYSSVCNALSFSSSTFLQQSIKACAKQFNFQRV
jgi:hypothetical protein